MKEKETADNIDIVKDLFAAFGSGDEKHLLSLADEDIEWITPGEDWPLAGKRRGHAGLLDLVKTSAEKMETIFPEAPEFIA